MFKRSDFIVTAFTKIEYVGELDVFQNPKNLTKRDMAFVLSRLNFLDGFYVWLLVCDRFSKRELIDYFNLAFDDLPF